MRDYASELFETEQRPPMTTEGTRDYAGEIWDEQIQRNFKQTDEISTITGQPKMEFTGEGGPGASFLSHLKAGFVDDPITKVRIYSADRFPSLSEEERMSRYRVKNGEVLYKDFDNKWYSESPDFFPQAAKKWMAEVTGDPSVLTGAAGEIAGGPIGAAGGAAVGEYIRQTIGEMAFDEPQDKVAGAAKVVGMGGLGLVGSIPGRIGGKVANEVGMSAGGTQARRVAKAAGKDLVNIDFRKAAQLKAYYKAKYGVELFDAQTTESRRLLDKINLYGDLPATADLVQSAKKIQDEQAYRAVKSFFNEIAPTQDPLEVGGEIAKAAQDSIQREVNKRVAVSKPLYDAAFKSDVKVDIAPHIAELDGLIEKWPFKSPEQNKLLQFRKMLFKADGDTPQDNLQTLDLMKKSVDSILKPSASEAPVDRAVKADIRRIKNNILDDMKKASPDYEQALKSWADTQDAFEEVAKKTRLASLSRLEGEEVVNATRRLFQSVGNSPEIMRKVKSRILQENPQAWDAAVRTHLEDIFNSATEATELNASKVFNNFWRKTIGSPKEREMLEVAMGKNFNNLVDFADMLRRIGLVGRRESTTATRMVSLAEEEWYGKSKAVAAATRPLMTYQRLIGDKLNNLMGDAAKKRFIESMLNPDTGRALQRIKVLGPGTEKGLKALSTFMSLLIGGEYVRYVPDQLMPAHKGE